LLYGRQPFVLATAFVAISALALGLGIDYRLGSEVRAETLLQNNPIHASVATGLICLCTIPYALHVARRDGLAPVPRIFLLALAGVTLALSIMAIYSLQSTGVWLAMGFAVPVLVALVALTERGWARYAAIAVIFVAALGAVANYSTLERIAGPSFATATSLVTDVAEGRGVAATMERLADDENTDASERERLLIWLNALEIWDESPVFGAGIGWLNDWWQQPNETSFNLLHNGYLEIAVRYGLVGLAFYGVLFVWSLASVRRAHRARLIDASALQAYCAALIFFLATLLSNSNIRLAVGESFMWFAASFAFFCHYLRQMKPEASAKL
jgi:O-antigen ligase